MSMDYQQAIKLIKKAYQKNADDKLFIRWITNYESSISFDDFKNRLNAKVENDNRTSDEILNEVQEWMKLYNFEMAGG